MERRSCWSRWAGCSWWTSRPSYFVVILLSSFVFMQKAALGAKRVHIVHWNKSNPMFRIDNTDNIIDVNAGNLRWEYDQANFICPVTRSAAQDDNGSEKYIIYNVSKEEYDMCMVTKPSSRIVATCTDPSQLLYFTITFRSFTPTPGGLEFHPGKDYYFISTSSPQDLYRRDGGRCVSHNMKVMFKVANISNTAATKSANNLKESSESVSAVNKPRITTLKPQIHLDDKHKYYPVVDDNDVETSEIDANTLESAKKVVRDFQNHRRRSYTDSTSNSAENEVVKQEASRMHSSATTTTVTSKTLLMMASILMNLMISKKN